jgi:hypothetical protein
LSSTFDRVKTFTDPTLSAGYARFNVGALGRHPLDP